MQEYKAISRCYLASYDFSTIFRCRVSLIGMSTSSRPDLGGARLQLLLSLPPRLGFRLTNPCLEPIPLIITGFDEACGLVHLTS